MVEHSEPHERERAIEGRSTASGAAARSEDSPPLARAFLRSRLFLTWDRPGSAVNRAIGRTNKRREEKRHGVQARLKHDRRKQGSRRPSSVYPLLFLPRWVNVATKKKKRKKKKNEERKGKKRDGYEKKRKRVMGDKKGEALRLACPGSLATVVRSDDTYLSTGRACVYAYSSLLIVYVSACREYTHVQACT